ncbi:hypothetical protein GSI_12047 [Ganoderma sinense ZZ0214-1]|uniref:Heterokaryon incompatibility domain-containing protein n=1 Tax=Ganoderma sinense ZZ0214-1 TaxID=1077348 RepID=A0A2G8RXP9_9APHY|nr:hypothetical protein GSI_12047 [Ganoderma sinense ZZ0214-1]
MWLLSTDRAELHYFARNFDAEGGYAVLSHTWDKDGEQSFQEVRAIAKRCLANGTNPRDDPELSPKIRECCILAEKHGYHWVWIDSCCIDKMSSSELSEAINSMYKWYKSSEVCYAYLKDVPSDDVVKARDSAFRKSRWHSRGWTLQELIAPDSVVFLSVDWRELGSRAELSLLLQVITGLPAKLMLGVTRPAEYSACIRMSWASKRQTTRIEDEAYCLMGLFGVNMPTNYGEGKRAFLRLQYEIMQHKECDMSLFAFGEPILPKEIIRDGIVFEGRNEQIDRDNPWQYLLGDSPRQFRISFRYIPDLGSDALQKYPPPQPSVTTAIGPFDRVELPHATVTSYGIQFRLPVAVVDDVTLAIILCQAGSRHFGLFLTRDDRAKDPQRPRYFVGRGYTRATTRPAIYLARMCDLGGDLYKLTFNGKPVQASWSTIYLVPTASDLDCESATSPNLLINCHPHSLFQLPRWLVDRLIGLRFEVDEARYSATLQIIRIVHRSEGRIYLCIGKCTKHPGGPEGSKGPLWAKVFVSTLVSPKEFTHDCSKDHLDSESWAMRWRDFGDEDRMVRLSFTESRRKLPETGVVIHLELLGRKFKKILQGSGISFPSVADMERDPPCTFPDALVVSRSSSDSHGIGRSLAEMLESSSDALGNISDGPIGALLQQLMDGQDKKEDSPQTTPQANPSGAASPQPRTPSLGIESVEEGPLRHTPDGRTIKLLLQRILDGLHEGSSDDAQRRHSKPHPQPFPGRHAVPVGSLFTADRSA